MKDLRRFHHKDGRIREVQTILGCSGGKCKSPTMRVVLDERHEVTDVLCEQHWLEYKHSNTLVEIPWYVSQKPMPAHVKALLKDTLALAREARQSVDRMLVPTPAKPPAHVKALLKEVTLAARSVKRSVDKMPVITSKRRPKK